MASLIVSIASLVVSIAVIWVAVSSLSQARKVADEEKQDWRQRKWFELYFKADEAYDALDHFQSLYPNSLAPGWGSPEWARKWNDLMLAMRTVNRMAVVFPRNAATDALFAATAAFANQDEAVSRDRLAKLRDAVEELRDKALVDPTVLV